LAALLRLLIIGGLAIAGIAFLLSQLAGVNTNTNVISRRLQREIDKLKAELGILSQKLVPIDQKEIELLSLDLENTMTTNSFGGITKGNLTSIYAEDLGAFVYKKLRNNDFILMVKTYHKEFLFVPHRSGTKVLIDDKPLGVIDFHGVLRTLEEKIQLGRLELHSNRYQDLYIGDRKVASLLNPKERTIDNARAFPLIDKLEEEDNDILLTLSMLSIIQQTID